jgi:hypothetical protein
MLGMVLLAFLRHNDGLLAFFLVVSILVYDAVHKAVAFSPVLMACADSFYF